MKKVCINNIVIGEGQPKICVPLMGHTDEDLLAGADAILKASKEHNISIVEFRGDYYDNLNDFGALTNVMSQLKKKFKDLIFLFTIRSHKEGGEKLSFEIPALNDINSFVIENRLVDMVDVELFSGEADCKRLISLAKNNDIRIIMSNHDFVTTPEVDTMVERLRTMQSYGADIAKIAVMPNNPNHVVDLLRATTLMKESYNDTPVVTISMGKMGVVSRVAGEVFGSAITFATINEASAPGQIPAATVNSFLEALRQ